MRINQTSKYVGVSFNKKTNKYSSTLLANDEVYRCGHFETEREAAKARDLKIIKLRLDRPLQILKPLQKN